MRRLFILLALLPTMVLAQNNTLQVATTPDSIPQSTVIPALGKDYTSIDSLSKDSTCLNPQNRVERRACKAKSFAEKIDSLIESRSFAFYPTTMQALPKGDMRMIYAGYYYLFMSPALVEVHLPAERGLSQYMTMLNFDTEQIADFNISKYLAEWSISLLMKSTQGEEYQISMTISTITGEARVLIENARIAMLYIGSVGERKEEKKHDILKQVEESPTSTAQIEQEAAAEN